MGKWDSALIFLGVKPKPAEKPASPPPAVTDDTAVHIEALAKKMNKYQGVTFDLRPHDQIVEDNHDAIKSSHQGNPID